jgi:formamidopyrimidine-DNA glycosylase
MPELPEVEALAYHLREHALYRPVARVDVAGMSVLKTFSPPPSALVGRVVTGAARYGKFLSVEFSAAEFSAAEFADRPDDPLHLITHLSRAGWLRWHDTAAAAPPKPGRGPLALRVHLDAVGGPGFDLTEAGTQKRLSVYLVADPQEVPGIARLGPDALALTRDELAERLAGRTERLKNLITDQTVIAGIGNAYSDEILHTAGLSPYAVAGRLRPGQVDELYAALRAVLTDAVERSVGQGAARLKGEKRSGLRVHARKGLPCPVCGDTVREVSFADRSFQYCPGCQTGGRPLADRRLSRLVR